MKKSNKTIMDLIAYVALVVVAVLIILTGLDAVGVKIFGSTVLNLLDTIKNVSILIVVGFASFNYMKNGGKAIKIIYWVAVAIFIVGTVLLWIK